MQYLQGLHKVPIYIDARSLEEVGLGPDTPVTQDLKGLSLRSGLRLMLGEQYDRYQGVEELMPFAKAVSAKSHEFDAQGNETKSDYLRLMQIVIDAGYNGYVGIEWEGGKPDEIEGTLLTKRLLERVRDELSSS